MLDMLSESQQLKLDHYTDTSRFASKCKQGLCALQHLAYVNYVHYASSAGAAAAGYSCASLSFIG